ncbi:DUF6998 domain-containing protein [Rhodovibrio salinarum]|uniref:DUF6998 domain-containing protein n=1 Tax=Rhodovibrio salinarum TaxID=1087 RepID=UPI00190574BE|nr:hypothetical protein [Rhodovibrio salinarum]
MIDLERAGEVLERARLAAVDYYRLTGKPLGITGEIGEYLAAKILHLQLADARAPGYDAIDGSGRKIQIKARCIPRDTRLTGQRLGSIRLEHEWDCVMLVLLDQEFRPRTIHELNRTSIAAALAKPGSKARNERGAMAVSQFISLGHEVWRESEGA